MHKEKFLNSMPDWCKSAKIIPPLQAPSFIHSSQGKIKETGSEFRTWRFEIENKSIEVVAPYQEGTTAVNIAPCYDKSTQTWYWVYNSHVRGRTSTQNEASI